MNKTTPVCYPVDNASILYLSLMRRNHANSYRFTMTMKDPVCPDTLQMAVDRIYRRFPTVISGFRPGFFCFLQVPAQQPPQVQQDPGMLFTMTAREIRNCPFRVYYSGCDISIEAFHALTDGYGAIACITTLAAEYLRLRHGAEIPVSNTLVDLKAEPATDEVADSYLDYEEGKPVHLPSRYAYQLPGPAPTWNGIQTSTFSVETRSILETARKFGISITTLISAVMAKSIMEIQHTHAGTQSTKPVRIMVPVDLRKQFPSRTLRNFILYALPTMEPADQDKPFHELLRSFAQQMRAQTEQKLLSSIMAYNVRTQRSWLFRCIPLFIKSTFMRIAYRFFGESNSSVTVTNLGNITLPEEMQRYVEDIHVYLTPRTRSPYNCSVLSYGGRLHIVVSRFGEKPELEEVFFRNLRQVLQGAAL